MGNGICAYPTEIRPDWAHHRLMCMPGFGLCDFSKKKKYNSWEISLTLIEILLSSIRGRTQFVKYCIFPLTLPSRTYISEMGGANITCFVLSVTRGKWNCGGREKKSSDDWGSGEAGGASTHPIPLVLSFNPTCSFVPSLREIGQASINMMPPWTCHLKRE